MNAMGDLHKAFACSVPYLKLWGVGRGRLADGRARRRSPRKKSPPAIADVEFYKAKLATAKFYATHVLTQSAWYKRQIIDGSGDVMTLSEDAVRTRSQNDGYRIVMAVDSHRRPRRRTHHHARQSSG